MKIIIIILMCIINNINIINIMCNNDIVIL